MSTCTHAASAKQQHAVTESRIQRCSAPTKADGSMWSRNQQILSFSSCRWSSALQLISIHRLNRKVATTDGRSKSESCHLELALAHLQIGTECLKRVGCDSTSRTLLAHHWRKTWSPSWWVFILMRGDQTKCTSVTRFTQLKSLKNRFFFIYLFFLINIFFIITLSQTYWICILGP